jgi:DNA-binding transcriptional ArsR family regulator
MSMSDDAATLAELAARVAKLEERLVSPVETDSGAPDLAQVFWALNELKRREARAAVLYTGVVETAAGQPVEWQMMHDSAELLEQDWAAQASTLAALGHPSRLQMLQLIARGEAQTAADLAHADGLGTTGQIYHHLRQLVAAGWLRTTTKGRHQVPPERLVPLLVILGASR